MKKLLLILCILLFPTVVQAVNEWEAQIAVTIAIQSLSATPIVPIPTPSGEGASTTYVNVKLPSGFEIECPCPEHPDTALIVCPVNKACPDSSGVATATVYDYSKKVVGADGIVGPTVMEHRIKSVSPCGCKGEFPICECIPNGTYYGTCANYLCKYEIKCNKEGVKTTPSVIQPETTPTQEPQKLYKVRPWPFRRYAESDTTSSVTDNNIHSGDICNLPNN